MKKQQLKLPKQLWTEESIDLTRHSYQGKLLTKSEGFKLGKTQRKKIPREQLSQLSERPKDTTALTIYDWSNQGRLEQLKPIRAKRMSVSPFTFYRGMPSLMLFDQAWEQHNSGLFQQICGDCHLSNFGGFASPERNLLFGINDFDETLVAPFEWDLKRLATSFVIAARDIDLADKVGLKAIKTMLNSYRQHLLENTELSPLQVWYDKVDASTLLENTECRKLRKKREKHLDSAQKRNAHSVLPKLTQQDQETGFRYFVDDAPLLWHPNTDEWQYFIEGTARMGVFASEGKSRTFDYRSGDVGYVPFAMGHYIENTGDTPLRFLEMFKSPRFQDVSLNQWMALTPPELVKANLNLNHTVMGSLRKEKWPVIKNSNIESSEYRRGA